ncbi:hypothetical protein P3T22_004720, partial [Paraburkholderia sp. GAS348]
GASGLLSRHRGHPSNYQLADGVAERALNLIRAMCKAGERQSPQG